MASSHLLCTAASDACFASPTAAPRTRRLSSTKFRLMSSNWAISPSRNLRNCSRCAAISMSLAAASAYTKRCQQEPRNKKHRHGGKVCKPRVRSHGVNPPTTLGAPYRLCGDLVSEVLRQLFVFLLLLGQPADLRLHFSLKA